MICPHCGKETSAHGTYHRYNKLGCRCAECKAFRAKEMRKYRKKLKRKAADDEL